MNTHALTLVSSVRIRYWFAIVAPRLCETMPNQYLIRTDDKTVKAWVFVGILQGLEEAYRIKIPMLDIFGERDWDVTRWGADERRKQIERVPGSKQIVVAKATHFFEGQEEDLIKPVVAFLDTLFRTNSKEASTHRP